MRAYVAATVAAIALGTGVATADDISPRSLVYIECEVNGRKSSGSGVVIDAEGRLLTAKHVIGERLNDTCKGAIGTQSNPAALSKLRVIALSDLHDVALLQFIEHEVLEPFVPVVVDPTVSLRKGKRVMGFGFHPGNVGPPDSTPGEVKTNDRDTGGLLGTTMNTMAGMSGGPVIADDRLVGLIKQEQYDVQGQATETRIVLLDEVSESRIVEALGLGGTRNVRQVLQATLSKDDVCTQLVREGITARGIPVAADIVRPFLGKPENTLAATAEYWVTVTTGPAEWIDCRSGSLLNSFYFPMGMVVRPERDVIDGDTTRTVFITEHGLRVFIDPVALQPVPKGVGYVFVSSDAAYKVCYQGEENCDPHREASNKETDPSVRVDWPFLTGYETYLRVPEGSQDLDAAHDELKLLRDFERDPPPETEVFARRFDLSDPGKIGVCKHRQGYLHSFFSHHDPTIPGGKALYPQPVTFSLCSFREGGVTNRLERMKIVTYQLAAERFSDLWAVTTMHFVPDNIREASTALFQAKDRSIVEEIGCDQPRNMFLTLASASQKPSLSAIIDGDQKRHSVFRQFQIAQAQSSIDIFDSFPLFNEIEISVDCDVEEGLRNNGSVIVDLVPLGGGDKYEMPLADFYNDLSLYFQDVGMPGIEVVNRRLREGTLYRICEFSEYIAVRTVLYNLVKDSSRVQRAREVLDVELDLMVDHLVHLIMASAVSTDARLRTSEGIGQGCES